MKVTLNTLSITYFVYIGKAHISFNSAEVLSELRLRRLGVQGPESSDGAQLLKAGNILVGVRT